MTHPSLKGGARQPGHSPQPDGVTTRLRASSQSLESSLEALSKSLPSVCQNRVAPRATVEAPGVSVSGAARVERRAWVGRRNRSRGEQEGGGPCWTSESCATPGTVASPWHCGRGVCPSSEQDWFHGAVAQLPNHTRRVPALPSVKLTLLFLSASLDQLLHRPPLFKTPKKCLDLAGGTMTSG